MPEIRAWRQDGLKLSEDKVNIDVFTDVCPKCHHGIEPKYMTGYTNRPRLQLIFRCPRKLCEALFIVYYFQVHGARWDNTFYFNMMAPISLKERQFSDIIHKISKEFSNLYNQAREAEFLGLKEICGAGYRKALEYLIKDYLILVQKHPKTKIEKKPLGNCIEECFEEGNIKTCAERAIWLGNDETHYYRKWIKKDLTDLKDLMDVTLYWIESEYKTKKFKIEMPPKKKDNQSKK